MFINLTIRPLYVLWSSTLKLPEHPKEIKVMKMPGWAWTRRVGDTLTEMDQHKTEGQVLAFSTPRRNHRAVGQCLVFET